MRSMKRAVAAADAKTAREDHMRANVRAHPGISRRHMLQLTAGGLALAGGVQSAWTQTRRIEALDPALDAIIDKSQSIQELATGYGGELGPAEGPVWWKEGGYLLFNDIHNSRRLKFTPGKGVTVDFRSEEHTSELQSRENLVCRLLLEKKKKTPTHLPPSHTPNPPTTPH